MKDIRLLLPLLMQNIQTHEQFIFLKIMLNNSAYKLEKIVSIDVYLFVDEHFKIFKMFLHLKKSSYMITLFGKIQYNRKLFDFTEILLKKIKKS